MAGYIAWLWAQWDHFSAVLPDSWRELRTRARCEGQHLRLPESLASLYLGLNLGLTYASELGALTEGGADGLRREGWAALVETGERQVHRSHPGWGTAPVRAVPLTPGRRKNNRGAPLQKWGH